jgi:putative sterol carrier protein
VTTDSVLEESFAGLRRIFRPDGAGSVKIVIQFELTGEDGVEFIATVGDRALNLERGRAPAAKVSMKMPAQEFLDMLSGKLPTTEAWLSGKLKVGGNLIYAMRLAPVFKFGSAGK